MAKKQCFKIKRGTEYDKAVKEHFSLVPKWKEVYEKVSELLGEKITRLGRSTDQLIIDPEELKNGDMKKLFKLDGSLKKNTKEANSIRESYQKIITEAGLSNYEEMRLINFAYGVMRSRGQDMESFRTSQNDIYYKADFDLEKKTSGLVIPISEIEYEEKYLEELKKLEKEKPTDGNQ